eukprot:4346488-Amphidinium_carterae.1
MCKQSEAGSTKPQQAKLCSGGNDSDRRKSSASSNDPAEVTEQTETGESRCEDVCTGRSAPTDIRSNIGSARPTWARLCEVSKESRDTESSAGGELDNVTVLQMDAEGPMRANTLASDNNPTCA